MNASTYFAAGGAVDVVRVLVHVERQNGCPLGAAAPRSSAHRRRVDAAIRVVTTPTVFIGFLQ